MIDKKWYLVREAGQEHWNGPFELPVTFENAPFFADWEKRGPFDSLGEGIAAIDCCGECDELDP